MSGYTGNPDAESEHALILSENGIAQARAMLPQGPSSVHCHDCGEEIPLQRRLVQKGCKYCIDCQTSHDKAPKVKMLDRIL
jgi:RNA polymerase-binding transcription factor DksA